MNTIETREVMYKRIRALRKREHYTQFDMAERLGISRRTYANYERGIHAMPVEALVVIADLFGTSLDYLAGRTPDRQEGLPL
jgi:transcriptional regulator with XRE-family HTH domain